MLSSTFELITMVASNSLLVFLVCNFIIVVLFVASSLQSSQVSDSRPFESPPRFDDGYSQSILEKANASSMTSNGINKEQKNGFERESLCVEEANVAVNISGSVSVEERKAEKEAEEGEEDELQRRAEEFIMKLKQHWMEEKFGKYVL